MTLGLCIYSVVRYLRHDRRVVIVIFAVYMAAISSWELIILLSDAVTAEQLKLLGKNIVNTVSLPVTIYSLVAFALVYTDQQKWIRWVAVACAVHIASLSVALFIMPELLYESNGLVTQGPLTIAGITFDQFVALDRTLKPAFLLYWVYGILLELTAVGLILRHIIKGQRDIVLSQMGAVLIGISSPLIGSTLLVTGVVPPAWNPTDFSFIVTAVAFALAVFRYRLFRLVPVGRQELVRIMDDPVVLIDGKNRVVDSNPTARDLFGVGSHWRGMAAESFFTPLVDDIGRVVGMSAGSTEISVETADTTRQFNLEITPLKDVDGGDTSRVVVMRDITVQKARQHELQVTKDELEQSNEELEQFAYAASHDLQEPLRTVSSYLEMLERRNHDVLDDDALEFIEFAVDGADRMQEMIQALLAYSRVDTQGKEFTPIDMTDIFETATQNLGVTIEEADARVSVPDSPGHILGDTSQLVQLFQNLIENGIKYSNGSPHVDLSVTRSDENIIEYAVTDDGIGMNTNQLDDIFEVFQRLHTREEFDGTGIGLSICQKIVDRHNGEIRVESAPGEGSTFFVALPAAEER
jgi:signal transduction histidine kinase